MEVGPASISIFMWNTHTHSPMVTSMVTGVIQKAFKEVELENPLLHLETCLQSSLSFISVTERGFMLFTQTSVNTVGIVVCLHSPNTTAHTYFCCLQYVCKCYIMKGSYIKSL